MQFPNNKATDITERIMHKLYKGNENAIHKLETSEYNRLYSHIYELLYKELKIEEIESTNKI